MVSGITSGNFSGTRAIRLLPVFLFLWLAAFANSARAENDSVSTRPKEYQEILGTIPDGYQGGRADAVYGTYRTPVATSARAMQNRLEELEQKIFGLNPNQFSTPEKYAEAIFLMENDALNLHQTISNSRPAFASKFEQQSMEQSSIDLYRNLSFHRDRAFENMVRFLDVKLPGPNGGQFRVDRGGEKLPYYLPNFRSDTLLSPAERNSQYQARVKKFIQEGGSLSEMKLFSKELVAKGKPFQWYEYVYLPNGSVRITEGKAGHILLGKGGPVVAAGQLVVLKNAAGEPTMVVLTNGSGSYKPDMISVHKVGERIAKQLKIPLTKIVYTKGEPITSQFYRIYSKGMGVPKDEIKANAKALENIGAKIFNRRCDQSFSLLANSNSSVP